MMVKRWARRYSTNPTPVSHLLLLHFRPSQPSSPHPSPVTTAPPSPPPYHRGQQDLLHTHLLIVSPQGLVQVAMYIRCSIYTYSNASCKYLLLILLYLFISVFQLFLNLFSLFFPCSVEMYTIVPTERVYIELYRWGGDVQSTWTVSYTRWRQIIKCSTKIWITVLPVVAPRTLVSRSWGCLLFHEWMLVEEHFNLNHVRTTIRLL